MENVDFKVAGERPRHFVRRQIEAVENELPRGAGIALAKDRPIIAVRTGWRRCSTCISEPPPPTSARSATPGRRSAHAGVCRKNLAPPADGKVIAGQIGTADMSGAKQRAPVDAFASRRYEKIGREHGRTAGTNAQRVRRVMSTKKKQYN